MNTPQIPQDPSPDDERDPTGVRDLLASLPDPGPMPDDVMRSIQSALEEEQRQREGQHTGVTPLTAASSSGEPKERRGRARWLRPVAGIGAAAAIGIGSLAAYQSLSDDGVAPVANPPGASQSHDGPDLKNRISIQNTGRDYTKSGLATQVASLTRPPKAGARGDAPSQSDAPVTTPEGLVTCMRSIIGLEIPDRISADLGTYEGKSAVIVVVTNDGKSEAWVVSRTCHNSKGKIAGPRAVT